MKESESADSRIALRLEYDGSRYRGFQFQPNEKTVQTEIEKALEKLYRQFCRVIPSGRTDSGVHARDQICHFDAPRAYPEINVIKALNSILPEDIRVLAAATVSNEFHARYDAVRRDYRYTLRFHPSALERGRSWYLPGFHELSSLDDMASCLQGEMDFTSFCSTQAEVNHKFCRVMESEWIRSEEHLIYRISANRFLHSMVRSLVGTMVMMARKTDGSAQFSNVLKACTRGPEIYTAPPQGLCLEKVYYPNSINWVTV